MKHSILVVSTLPFLASCSAMGDMASRNATNLDLPGIQTQINCNPEPTLIYSKAGNLIDTVIPVLHPSCSAQSALGEVKNQSTRSWRDWFGPASLRTGTSPTEATDDDPTYVRSPDVAANSPSPASTPLSAPPGDATTPAAPAAPNQPAAPSKPVEPEPAPAPALTGGCGGAASCEPDSKTEPEAYKAWKEERRRNGIVDPN